MKKVLIVLLILIPSSSFAVSQTEIDAAKAAFVVELMRSKTAALMPTTPITQRQAETIANSWGMYFEDMLKENEKQKIWTRYRAPTEIGTCAWSHAVAQASITAYNAGTRTERQDILKEKRRIALLYDEGWTKKEVIFCLGYRQPKE